MLTQSFKYLFSSLVTNIISFDIYLLKDLIFNKYLS